MQECEVDENGLGQNFVNGGCEVSGIGDILEALRDNSTVSVDLATEAAGSPWRIEGCMHK